MTLAITAQTSLQRAPNWPQRLRLHCCSFNQPCKRWHEPVVWTRKGHRPRHVTRMGAVSIGVSIVFALSFPGIISATQRREWAQAVIISIALALSGTYSVAAALGSASGGRAAATASEKANADTRAKAQTAWDGAKAELDKLANTNPIAELDALIADTRNELARTTATRSVAELSALVSTAESVGPAQCGACSIERQPQHHLPRIVVTHRRSRPRPNPRAP